MEGDLGKWRLIAGICGFGVLAVIILTSVVWTDPGAGFAVALRVLALVSGGVLGGIAAAKTGRNGWLWGIVGGIFASAPFIWLAFAPPVKKVVLISVKDTRVSIKGIYQPNRQDLLINTNWGIPASELTEDRATEKGLVLLNQKWVTPEEKKILKAQHLCYHTLRLSAQLLIVFGALMLFGLAAPSKMDPSEVFGKVLLFIGGGLMLVSGIGLLKYRSWASRLITSLFYLSAVTCLGIILWVRTGFFQNFFEAYPFLSGAIVISAILMLFTGIGTWYITRPSAREILNRG